MHIAVIITTYNRPDALAAVLEGYLAQDDRDFEILIADDGSTDETRRVVEAFAARAPFAIHHVWQEDRGFRAAAARNRALAAARAEYIIFTDGDCVPRTNFVAQHRRLAQPGRFLAGNRALLNEAFTREALEKKLPIHAWTLIQWREAAARGDINRWLPLVELPGRGVLRNLQPRRWRGAKTCNLSAWRADLLRVNGLDEAYSGWGLEDSDLVVRLLHAGVWHKSARYAAPVLHLWHRENDRGNLPENQRRLRELLGSSRITAQLGVSQYL